MLHRLRCGSTQENNTWRLPEGVITWDRDQQQLRLHNGRLPGGFAVQAEKAFQPILPGPQDSSLPYAWFTPGMDTTGDQHIVAYNGTTFGIRSRTLKDNRDGWRPVLEYVE